MADNNKSYQVLREYRQEGADRKWKVRPGELESCMALELPGSQMKMVIDADTKKFLNYVVVDKDGRVLDLWQIQPHSNVGYKLIRFGTINDNEGCFFRNVNPLDFKFPKHLEESLCEDIAGIPGIPMKKLMIVPKKEEDVNGVVKRRYGGMLSWEETWIGYNKT